MNKHGKISVFSHIRLFLTVTFVGAFLTCNAASASPQSSLEFVNPTHGFAKIEGKATDYFYFKTKISAKQKSDLSFKEKDCLLVGRTGGSYSKCWIYVAGWSAGLSVSQRAPIMMNTLSVELSENKAATTHQWNTSMVDGPNGALEFSIPENGFVELYFLWKIPEGFSASSVKIGDKLKIDFKKN